MTAPRPAPFHPPPRAGEGDRLSQASLRSMRRLGCVGGGGGVWSDAADLPDALSPSRRAARRIRLLDGEDGAAGDRAMIAPGRGRVAPRNEARP